MESRFLLQQKFQSLRSHNPLIATWNAHAISISTEWLQLACDANLKLDKQKQQHVTKRIKKQETNNDAGARSTHIRTTHRNLTIAAQLVRL